jgi:hypothetical protein
MSAFGRFLGTGTRGDLEDMTRRYEMTRILYIESSQQKAQAAVNPRIRRRSITHHTWSIKQGDLGFLK